MSIDVKNAQGSTVTIKTIDDLLVAMGEIQNVPTLNTQLGRLKAIQDLLIAGNTVLGALLTGPLYVIGQAGENHLGEVGGRVVVASSTRSRPNDATAYAVGDLIANDTVAANVSPFSFAAPRIADGNGKIIRIRVKTTDTAFAGKIVRLHLYKNLPTVSNGDNGAWLSTESDYLGYAEVTLDRHFSDAEKGIAAPSTGSAILFQATGTAIYGLLECRSAVTPTAVSAFVCALEIEQN